MQSILRSTAVVMLLGLWCAGIAHAEEGCLDFKWDVSKERALFAGRQTSLAAGTEPAGTPPIALDRAYSLKLQPQRQVQFAAGPGKSSGERQTFAGLLRIQAPSSGEYRVSIDQPFWLDVVSGTTLLIPVDFQGQHTCSAPHKIVVFSLQAGQSYLLQLSNGPRDGVVVTVTAAPPRKP